MHMCVKMKVMVYAFNCNKYTCSNGCKAEVHIPNPYDKMWREVVCKKASCVPFILSTTFIYYDIFSQIPGSQAGSIIIIFKSHVSKFLRLLV